jgi:hypothetical protein
MREPPGRSAPEVVQCALKGRQVEPGIGRIGRHPGARAPLVRGGQRNGRLGCAGAVATREHRRKPAREMDPFPLIEVAPQAPEGRERVR